LSSDSAHIRLVRFDLIEDGLLMKAGFEDGRTPILTHYSRAAFTTSPSSSKPIHPLGDFGKGASSERCHIGYSRESDCIVLGALWPD
jgi:hypothetical protein